MPGPVVHVGATILCPHGGQGLVIPGSPRVLVGGMPVATMADMDMVVGCAFAPVKPQPCVRIQWMTPATRVLVGGSPPILQTTVGICLSVEQIPNGPPIIAACQTRVVAT